MKQGGQHLSRFSHKVILPSASWVINNEWDIMRTKESLRVALVGCGHVAQQQHIPSLLKIKRAEIVAICDKNEALVKRVSERFHVSRYYTDFSKMLEREPVDMVDICTLPQTHLALSTEVMKAGHHVLIEKPMALSLEDADSMVATAKASQVELCVVHNELFLPVMLRARSMINSGIIGDIMGISIKDSWLKDNDLIQNKDHWCHKLPGGLFGEMLPHSLYLASAILGQLEPVVVHGRKFSKYDWVAADELRVIMENNSSLAIVTLSANWSEDTMVLDIFGTKMNLHVDLWDSVIIRYATGKEGRLSRAWGNISQGLQWFMGTATTGFDIISGRHHNGHYTVIQRFVESLQNGTEPPITTKEAREVVRLYELITSRI